MIEAGFGVVFRIPKRTVADEFQDFLLHGGTIITPEGEIIVMEYAKHTWRLPMPANSVARAITKNRVENLNSFECLTDRDMENDSSILVSDLKLHTRNEQAQRRLN